MAGMRIRIDGELYHVKDIFNGSYVDTVEGPQFYLAEDSEAAGKAAREYWEDMADNDPKEFTCIVGEEALIQWGLGRSASPGSVGVSSLTEWLDLWLDHPEEHWASDDSTERTVERCGKLADDLGFMPTVAYRAN